MNVDELIPMDAGMNARLIDAAGSDEFGRILLSAANDAGNIEELFGYSTTKDGHPCKLISCSLKDGADERVERYSNRYFHHDPALRTMTEGIGLGGFYRRVRPSEILAYDYRHLCFDQPHFAEKLSFGWRHENGLLVLSFYLSQPLDDRTAIRLARLADVALAAMMRVQVPFASDALIGELERRLRQARPVLTARENQVCARHIAGWSAEQIANDLALGTASVHTYRRRACQRYALRSPSDFLADLIHWHASERNVPGR